MHIWVYVVHMSVIFKLKNGWVIYQRRVSTRGDVQILYKTNLLSALLVGLLSTHSPFPFSIL